MKELNPSEELKHLKAIYGEDSPAGVYNALISAFTIIQTRGQILLSLATICLTITGFSGPKIAESNSISRYCIALGLVFVLISIAVVLSGPMRIKWLTQLYLENMDKTMEELIQRRNVKTKQYHQAMVWLGIGLFFYVLSVVSFLIKG